MERLLKSLIPVAFLVIAIVLYTLGMAAESFLVIALGVLFEGAFWVKLFKLSSENERLETKKGAH
ncbi:hypothetical protein J1N51_06090 [Psychrosphaera ytuae]|uniref:Uncharacterized protein n=1 Tax=Psychrosphaera ytuae TaxID=2820710 RepID=A0A975DDP5_9GAMM|nr:hypothetical protein [Psychrosphaera ytuae]QTH65013.1 hypothetical protein J1N51_06090 [Psychrosphaera ytuae]